MPTPEETAAALAAQQAAGQQQIPPAPGPAPGADGSQTPGQPQSTEPPTGIAPPLTFAAWLEAQPPAVSAVVTPLYEEHTRGLKGALESERGTRKDLEKQMRDLAEKAEKGSELQGELTKMADSAQEADRRASFYEVAHAAGVANLKLAYTAAVQDEMFDKRGAVNFETFKQQYPELFGGKPTMPPGNAGAGTGAPPPPPAPDMNSFIRSGGQP